MLTFRNAVHRPRLLDLLLRAHRIAFLQELSEGGADALRDRILYRLWEVREGGVAMDALQITQHQIRYALRRGFHGLQRVDHR